MTAPRNGSPPYLSYSTFRSFLDSLAAIGVPNRIDRSLLSSKSGTTQMLLLGAIRYFGLISDHGLSAPELERLVKAEGAERRSLWRKILAKAYPAFFNADINLERVTTDQLAEIFRSEGVSSPATIRKCVTFFSRASKDAGIQLSPYVKPYAGARPSTRRERGHQNEETRTKKKRTTLTEPTGGRSSTALELLLGKAPVLDPKWTREEIENWLLGIEGLKRIAGEVETIADSTPLEEYPDEERET